VLLANVIRALRAFYGLLPAPPEDLFAFFVWEVISRHALPARRDLAWHAIKRIPALTPDAMFRAAPKKLQDAIGLAGPHRDERLEQLREGTAVFRRHREFETRVEPPRHDGDSPRRLFDAARALADVPHLESAGRHRALLFVGRFRVLPVDDGMARVAARLGLAPVASVRAARRALTGALPPDIDAYRDAALYLAHHAEHACIAHGPHCHVCPLAVECPAARA
jgi:endonuclease III